VNSTPGRSNRGALSARANGHDEVRTLRTMLAAIAGADQSVDPWMRAFYL
jgi:hypothetical protein